MSRNDPLRNSPVIAWFDLETTGNREDDRIIEVGLSVTDRDLNELTAGNFVVKPENFRELAERMDDVVVEMHSKNGLLPDVSRSTGTIEAVDRHIATILSQYAGSEHVPFAGSGVAHFDRKYIRREMPLTDKHLTYWALDIGAYRRFMKLWGIEVPAAELAQAKTHRALDDIREHIAEAKAYRDYLRGSHFCGWAPRTND